MFYIIKYKAEKSKPCLLCHANPYLKFQFNIIMTKYKSTYYEEAPRIVANIDTK